MTSEKAKRVNFKPHHTFFRTFAHVYAADRTTEWWTVDNEKLFYDSRDASPFTTLFCNTEKGGLVVYLDKPRT